MGKSSLEKLNYLLSALLYVFALRDIDTSTEVTALPLNCITYAFSNLSKLRENRPITAFFKSSRYPSRVDMSRKNIIACSNNISQPKASRKCTSPFNDSTFTNCELS